MTSKFSCRAALIAASGFALLGSTSVMASVTASAYIEDERTPIAQVPDPVHGDVTATQTGGVIGSSHFASTSADAGTGILRATAQAGLAGPYLLPATTEASISDSITFSGGFGGTAYLDWSFHGDIALSNSPYNGPYTAAVFGQFNVYAATVFGSSGQITTLSAFANTCGTGCVVGTSIERTGSIAIPINEYGATIGAGLGTFATYGNLADFGNTSRLYLRLPDGVSFTSSSGHFLQNAAPIFVSSVPEPSSVALMLGGLAVCGVVARHQRPGATRSL